MLDVFVVLSLHLRIAFIKVKELKMLKSVPSKVFIAITLTGGCFLISSPVFASVGVEVADELQARYADTSHDCGSPSKPAFLCSGVILRGTFPSEDYDSWNPSPDSVKSGGVSFSYLRQDVKFGELAYSYANGFIFYPILHTPDELVDIDILCYFPKDADSVNRNEKGCGRNTRYLSQSRPCDEHIPPIESASKWVDHYQAWGISYRNAYQCGFNVRDSENEKAGPRFYTAIEARNQLEQEVGYIAEQNEFRLATWEQNLHGQVPIQAFFYVPGGSSGRNARPEDDPAWQERVYNKNISVGLAGAQHDQQVMYQRSGRVIPIIRLSLPNSDYEEASFTYHVEDQLIVN